MPERFAIYFAPATTDPLWLRAAQWLGRDAAGGLVPEIPVPGMEAERRLAITASARRYGFHATIKAPLFLAQDTSRAELEAELRRFVLGRAAVPIGPLKLTLIDGFLALVPERQGDELTAFAAACVARFERFRAPLGAAERERRIRNGGLTARQVALLDRYGYPWVMDEFIFHMTLTDRLDEADVAPVRAAAASFFAPVLERPIMLDRLSLFHEADSGAPFRRLEDFPFAAEARVDA